jgi:hypothetical protein
MGRRAGFRHGAWRALLAVAAGSVGFAVGDVLTQPVAIAATSRSVTGARDDFSWSWRLKPGQLLKIQGINGDIHAGLSRDGEAHVRAHKHARRSDPASVRIEVNTSDEGVVVCALYPSRHGENTCDFEGSHQHNDNNDVVVDFEVEVPRGVRFTPRTVNGGIEAEDLDGPVDAGTVNGSVVVGTRSWASAGTVNGSVRASLGERHWTEPLKFGTVNGSITVELPAGAGCELEATTLNGEVETDFPITVSGRMGHRRLHGTLGDGGGRLEAETVNGSIHLLERR